MRIHKWAGSSFFPIVTALLFLAVCAWIGAALYGRLVLLPQPDAQPAAAPALLQLQGIAIRRERLLCARRPVRELAESGQRLPRGGEVAVTAGGKAVCTEASAVFFADWDGWEHLEPPEAETLEVAALQALLDSAPRERAGAYGRLVLEQDWYFAALADEGFSLPAGRRCRLQFAEIRRLLPARLLWVSPAADGQRALLFRLTEGGADCLSLRKCQADLVLSGALPLMIREKEG